MISSTISGMDYSYPGTPILHYKPKSVLKPSYVDYSTIVDKPCKWMYYILTVSLIVNKISGKILLTE